MPVFYTRKAFDYFTFMNCLPGFAFLLVIPGPFRDHQDLPTGMVVPIQFLTGRKTCYCYIETEGAVCPDQFNECVISRIDNRKRNAIFGKRCVVLCSGMVIQKGQQKGQRQESFHDFDLSE